MSRLQKKPPAHKRGHPTLQNMNFFYFCGSFLPSWIRIRIQITDPDPDPMVRLNTDPIRIRIRNPVHYFAFFDVKLHAPGSRPFTELGEGQLEPPSVVWSGDSVSELHIICKFPQNFDEPHNLVNVVNVDREERWSQDTALRYSRQDILPVGTLSIQHYTLLSAGEPFSYPCQNIPSHTMCLNLLQQSFSGHLIESLGKVKKYHIKGISCIH